jgi:hypothetical protein
MRRLNLYVLSISLCGIYVACMAPGNTLVISKPDSKRLTIKAINDVLQDIYWSMRDQQGCYNIDRQEKIVISNKLQWRSATLLGGLDKRIHRDTRLVARDEIVFISNADIEHNKTDFLEARALLKDTIDTKSWCFSNEFSRLYKTNGNNKYVMQWFAHSSEAKQEAILLLQRYRKGFRIVEYIDAAITYD